MEAWEKAIADLNAKFDASLAESKVAIAAAEADKTKAEADAKAALESVADTVKEALASYKEKTEAIDAAGLLPEQAEPIVALAAEGEDITAALAEAVKVATAFKNLSEAAGGSFVRSTESAPVEAKASLPKGW